MRPVGTSVWEGRHLTPALTGTVSTQPGPFSRPPCLSFRQPLILRSISQSHHSAWQLVLDPKIDGYRDPAVLKPRRYRGYIFISHWLNPGLRISNASRGLIRRGEVTYTSPPNLLSLAARCQQGYEHERDRLMVRFIRYGQPPHFYGLPLGRAREGSCSLSMSSLLRANLNNKLYKNTKNEKDFLIHHFNTITVFIHLLTLSNSSLPCENSEYFL